MASIADLLRDMLGIAPDPGPGAEPPVPFPVIPDPNQLSIPSEPVVRGDFTSRLPSGNLGVLADLDQAEIGARITLKSLLSQLPTGSFPSLRGPKDSRSFADIDIMFSNLFGGPNNRDKVTAGDLSYRELIDSLVGREI